MTSQHPAMIELPGNKAKSRKVITLEMKLDILRRSERGEKISKIARDFSMATSTISTIIRNKKAIKKQEHLSLSSGGSCYITRGRDWLMEEMERVLSLWIEAENAQERTPTVKTIREKARSIWSEVKSTGPRDANGTLEKIQYESFVASHGWYDRYRKRYNVNSGTITKNRGGKIITPGNEIDDFHDVKRIPDNESKCVLDDAISKNKEEIRDIDDFTDKNGTGGHSDESPSPPDTKSLATIFTKVDEALRLIKDNDPEMERSLDVAHGIEQSIRCYRDLFVDVQETSEPAIRYVSDSITREVF